MAGSDIVAALSEYLYSSEQAWAPLTSALDQAINHRDGSLLAVQEDQAAASKDDGGGAFQAVTCLDYPVEGDKTTWAAQYEEAERVAPIFGDSSIGIDLACSAWGHNGIRKPAPIHARGARRSSSSEPPGPGHPVLVGQVPRRPARLRPAADLGGQRAHRLRRRRPLRQRRRQYLPAHRHHARGGPDLPR